MALDPIRALSNDLAIYFLSFLTPIEIPPISSVSKWMNAFSIQPMLWQILAARFHIQIDPKGNPKDVVIGQWTEYARVNRIFTTSMNYLREQIPYKPQLFPRIDIPVIPAGSNHYESYQNILKWCFQTPCKINIEPNEVLIKSKVYSILQEIARPASILVLNLKDAPKELQDPRLRQLFYVAANKFMKTQKHQRIIFTGSRFYKMES